MLEKLAVDTTVTGWKKRFVFDLQHRATVLAV
jgi:hypothetical protein